ncbi:unnamed protein product [Symbiodinium natans]|uniref:Uncharacterized protein n=1 Tax=Symbiodinium natans TaxID=878477 RepID=A0A812L769_9DINO|nr:unnamed protein product [Symbiodinium natans]
MDMDDDIAAEKQRLTSLYGELLFSRFMEFLLSDVPKIWQTSAACCAHPAEMPAEQAEPAAHAKTKGKRVKAKAKGRATPRQCPTPVGLLAQPSDAQQLHVASAGTVCVDVSKFGDRILPICLWGQPL